MRDVEQLSQEHQQRLASVSERVLRDRTLILASNRGPVEFRRNEFGQIEGSRGSGGLVTAISAVSRLVAPVWIAAAMTEADREQAATADDRLIEWRNEDARFNLRFVVPDAEDYRRYYNEIANPLLWFLQHYMWDAPRTPNITEDVWAAWAAYERVNAAFADAIFQEIERADHRALVLLQDYHLYLVGSLLRQRVQPATLLSLFVHIPWPGPDYWALLPQQMRDAILRSCCALDVIGFQTNRYRRAFLNTCLAYLPEAQIGYSENTVTLDGHTVHLNVYPISIDVPGLLHMAETSPTVRDHRYRLRGHLGDQTIVRIDRVEPSKNIVRGFQAFELMLEKYPEHRGRVKFLSFLVPSRLSVEEYGRYLEEIMIRVGWINTRYGTGEWQPIELFVGDDYERGIAAMQLYDVLLVNPIIDGMNLVVKEGATVNATGGVIVLSEGAGAAEQLAEGVLMVSPSDIVGTAEALHQALTMPLTERYRRAALLKRLVAEDDIAMWLYHQLEDYEALLERAQTAASTAAPSGDERAGTTAEPQMVAAADGADHVRSNM
ncbi:alpha,alpha-trehalose-phosphate synthase (UDP-forming) [Kallotenue papyrolyticum]|uniref:alpha,alpha-trehalose-phosphate synthase (UDP-forming) n=1 Tax=Kallotenue papyrolyticum TaxID=1325125 RepID=UPI00047857DD|nr:trehalose-6-phosphate synthase [Kallotenue papyrolyticum]